jgi:predicted LPLAT superfamily acyltransferase
VSREVPALAAFVMREGRDSYRVIQELLPAAGTPQELAAAYAAALEKVVRRYPDQWYNFYDFWA